MTSTDDMPLVSVVIACFEQAHFIGETVASARSQTHSRVEVVVVDDGSQDATAGVARSAGADVVLRQANAGAVAARNAGLTAATGEYVVFLDGDDRLHAHAVETQLRHLQAVPAAAFVIGRNRLVDAGGHPLRTPVEPRCAGDLYEQLLRRPWICPPSAVLARRSVLQELQGWDAGLNAGEDLDLYLRLAQRFVGIDHTDVVTDYRVHAGMNSRAYRLMLDGNLHVLSRHAVGPDADPRLRAAREQGEQYFSRMLAPKIALSELGTAMRTRRGVIEASRQLLCLLQQDAPGVGAVVRGRLARRRSPDPAGTR